MRVEFVSPYDHSPYSGIGRYLHTLVHHLSGTMDAAISRPRFLPLAKRFSPLRNLPVGIEDHQPGSAVHFPQIIGCAMMLYRPYRPSVATVHDLGVLELPEEWKMFDPVARQMLKLSFAGLKRVGKIVADSEFTRQGVIKHLGVPENRVVTVYPGIDHTLFRPISGARAVLVNRHPRLGAVASAPWLLYVGSEQPRKKIAALLQAISLLREETPGIRLIKVGSAGGDLFRQETLRIIQALGLEDYVIFFEGTSDEELPLFYNAADLFVTTSKLEGFGFPVLEAMACGTPVVCSNAGSLPEITGEAARLVNSTDVSGICKEISSLLLNGTMQSDMKKVGLSQSLLFSWPKTVRNLELEYLSIEKNFSRSAELKI